MSFNALETVAPKAALTNAKVLWFAFSSAPVMYLIVGEVIRATVDDFPDEGISPIGGADLAARIALLGWFFVSSFIADRAVSENRILERASLSGVEGTDSVVAAAMQTALVLRFVVMESVAIMGLVLYLFSGDRIEYVFLVGTTLSLLRIRPTEDKWNATFREAMMRYPGVSSSLT